MNKFRCYQCDAKEVAEYDEDNVYPNYDKERNAYCDRCWQEYFQFYCPICEEHQDKEPECPDNTFFYLHLPHDGLKPGYYRVKDFPVWTSDIFSVTIQTYNVEQASDNICYKHDGPLEDTDYICRSCFEQKGWSTIRAKAHVLWAINSRKVRNPNKFLWTVFVSPEYFRLFSKRNRRYWTWRKGLLIIMPRIGLSGQEILISRKEKALHGLSHSL
jgi:hypothetical protein